MMRATVISIGALVALVALGGLAEAQAVPVDYTKGHLAWTEDPLAGVPTSYTMKCGPTSGGPYTKTKNYPVAPPLTTSAGNIPISDLVTVSGTYFCVVSASSIIGESANSTEVTFQAGRLANVPTGLAVLP